MKPRDALWLAAFMFAVLLVTLLSDEVTSHAPAQPAPPEPDLSNANKQAWLDLAMRADADPVWGAAARGALFTRRFGQGEA